MAQIWEHSSQNTHKVAHHKSFPVLVMTKVRIFLNSGPQKTWKCFSDIAKWKTSDRTSPLSQNAAPETPIWNSYHFSQTTMPLSLSIRCCPKIYALFKLTNLISAISASAPYCSRWLKHTVLFLSKEKDFHYTTYYQLSIFCSSWIKF